MPLLPLAGLNVLFFRARVWPAAAALEEGETVPWRGRLVGIVSVTLWIVILVLGRLTAYFADPIYRSMYQ